jgi:hypothetical protein
VVEEQSPFCAACGAPQIRVAARQSQDAEHPALPPPPLPTDSAQIPVVHPRVGAPDSVDWKTFLRIAAPTAGVVGIVAILFPLVWLALFPASVFLAIHLYRRGRPASLKTSQGVKMGALIGFFTFLILALYVVGQVVQDPAVYRQNMQSALKEAAGRNPTPETAQMAENLSGTAGLVLLSVFATVFALGFMAVIGAISGAVAASLSRHKSGP